MDKDIARFPKWAKEIVRFFVVKSQYILYGNIYDVYPYYGNGNEKSYTLPLKNYLSVLLSDYGEYNLIVLFEPLFGFTLLKGDENIFKNITGKSLKDTVKITLTVAYDIIEALTNNKETHSAVIIDFASRLNDISEKDLNEFLYKSFRLSINIVPRLINNEKYPKYNLLFFLVEKENDLPAWYSLENPKIKSLAIPKPNSTIRESVAYQALNLFADFKDLPDNKRIEIVNTFVDQTSGMMADEIVSIVQLALEENLMALEISEAVRRYKIGITENQWAKINRDKLKNAEDIIKLRVKGQHKYIK
jgi:hypothetical protein